MKSWCEFKIRTRRYFFKRHLVKTSIYCCKMLWMLKRSKPSRHIDERGIHQVLFNTTSPAQNIIKLWTDEGNTIYVYLALILLPRHPFDLSSSQFLEVKLYIRKQCCRQCLQDGSSWETVTGKCYRLWLIIRWTWAPSAVLWPESWFHPWLYN